MELTVPMTGGVLCHLEKFFIDESFLIVGMTFFPVFGAIVSTIFIEKYGRNIRQRN